MLADDYAHHLHELLGVLKLEHEALKDRKYDNIRACTEQKEILLGQLAQLEAQRKTIEQQADPLDVTEIRTHFKERIAPLVEQCGELNTLNGGVAEISRQFNQRMLNIILGGSADDDDLYNATGNNMSNKLSQVFAKI